MAPKSVKLPKLPVGDAPGDVGFFYDAVFLFNGGGGAGVAVQTAFVDSLNDAGHAEEGKGQAKVPTFDFISTG